jgi:hypothetical protein
MAPSAGASLADYTCAPQKFNSRQLTHWNHREKSLPRQSNLPLCKSCRAFPALCVPVRDDTARTQEGRNKMSRCDSDTCWDSSGRCGLRRFGSFQFFSYSIPYAYRVLSDAKNNTCAPLAETLATFAEAASSSPDT